jgi:D-amino-acid dehydrogenase
MKICVIGAGIIGCATAYHLARLGHKVHLIDAAKQPGSGTSFANGAQLSYSYVEPFASPATLRSIPTLLLSTKSPIRFRLKADVQQWMWLTRFLLACRASRVAGGTERLLQLARTSRHVLEGWLMEERWEVKFRQNGKLVLCPDAGSLQKQVAQVRFQASLGCQQEVLSRQACIDREPALANSTSRFVGGVWTPDECVADPFLLCVEMARSVARLGGEIWLGAEVQSLVKEGANVVAALTQKGAVSADAFVLATGAQSPRLAKQLGVSLPLYPLKGYSITVPFHDRNLRRPVASVTDLGRKTVFAPLGDQLRVAAMVEIGGHDLSIPRERVQAMLESVNTTYPGLCELGAPLAWAGLRPATPDSVPLMGRIRQSNVFLNTGHGALGLTLAAGSAVQLGLDIERAARQRLRPSA